MSDEQVIRSPDGVEWRIGERVAIRGSNCYPDREACIVRLEWDGSWDPNARDVDSAWIRTDDGFCVRPMLLHKLS